MNYLNLESKKVEKVAKALNQLLAEYHVYYQKLRNFHWNIKGENFFTLHVKFEELYNDAQLKIDEIAERILSLRKRPVSTFSEYLDLAEIKERRGEIKDKQMVREVLDAHSILIKNFRNTLEAAEKAEDSGTEDMISGFLGDMEKNSWMLDAFISANIVEIKK